MWLMKSPKGFIENGFWMQHHWVNNCTLVGKHYWWKTFKEKNFLDITPKNLKNIEIDLTGTGKKVLVIRPGGFGDKLMMTGALRILKSRYPKLQIHLIGLSNRLSILRENKDLSSFLRIPMHSVGSILEDYDDVYDYTGIVASNPKAQIMNAYEHYIKFIMSDVSENELKNIRPQVNITKEEELVFEQRFSKEGLKPDDKYIVISLESTSPLRNWGVKSFHELTKLLTEYFPSKKVVLVGLSEEISKTVFYVCRNCGYEGKIYVENKDSLVEPLKIKCKRCSNQIHYYNKEKFEPDEFEGKFQNISPFEMKNVLSFLGLQYSFREVAYLIKYCDLLITPDTGTMHLAAAFKTPQLALFSAFDGDLRLRYFEEASWIQHEFPCAPCFLHTLSCPYNDKIGEEGIGACMKDLKVEEVFEKARDIVHKGKSFRPESLIPKEVEEEVDCKYVCGGKAKYICRKGNFIYYICLNCGSIFTPNPASLENANISYNNKDYAKVFRNDNSADTNKKMALELTLKCPGIKEEFNSWLDIGCSIGLLLEGAKLLDWDIEGVEISKDACEEAVSKLGNCIHNIDFKDFKTEKKFGLISCHQTLEHIGNNEFNQYQALKKMKDLLEDDGIISLYNPSADLFPGDNVWIHLNTFFAGEHICILSRKGLSILCGELGLEIVEFRSYHLAGDFWTLLRKKPLRRKV